ncbi:HAD-IB family hydrolase [Streptobacillus moniliformis]|uniref:phosphoserine phosphatase n=1 Tax=Streptobacillus moniliformis (strain ATCC 14647 / DSM 12112 / NCTC 10651 / 9901) TaxID=519441 RepID=D1AXN5_STRM9|nr:HAD-IB family hydrolase [Streptobacillus moniliformis]ACZ01061.1 HAD-superfamily subfamily IB hydrolase, TIGR01490 [Streptobacillus moniliformis DSM 12112]AVL42571.1 HAD-IB family hydrolase [Streptobacillus moniliformis]QXW65836.1 HAD-IB family hydrolase [Streptobacillus moniliformis]SQA13797.1 ACT domain-containing protein [Streptobacillus moniliformis]
MKKIAAFFDVDGTIFRNSLLIEHFKMLIKFEFIDEGSFFGDIRQKFKMWEERKGTYDDYLEELVDIYIECIKNVEQKDIDYVAQRVIENRAQKMYAYSRNKIKDHLEKGHLIIIISGSPSFLVDKMAKKLNATDFIATEYLLDENNKYNGENIPMWDSKSKIKAIKDFEKKYDIDLENSYAYGDTTGDFGMFEMVGNPVAINPAKKLFKKISNDKNIKDKIKIVVERKDMIYILDSNVEFM